MDIISQKENAYCLQMNIKIVIVYLFCMDSDSQAEKNNSNLPTLVFATGNKTAVFLPLYLIQNSPYKALEKF